SREVKRLILPSSSQSTPVWITWRRRMTICIHAWSSSSNGQSVLPAPKCSSSYELTLTPTSLELGMGSLCCKGGHSCIGPVCHS
uniref:Uncharacterized protein n=1 Tax=Chelydra serpentina TaxID=8475 RepID=A0A8C3S2B1_CHESE